MNRKAIIIAALIGASALTAVPFVHAEPGRPDRVRRANRADRPHHAERGSRVHAPAGILGNLKAMKAELNLTDAQVEQIRTIYRDLAAQNQASREQLRDGFGDAARSLVTDPSNLAAAQAMLDRQISAERAVRNSHLAATARALTVLTPEQRTKLAERMDQRRARVEERRERLEQRREQRRKAMRNQ